MLKRSLASMVVLAIILFLNSGCGGGKDVGASNPADSGNGEPGTDQTYVEKATIKFAYIVMPQAAPQALINREEKIFENQLEKLGKEVEFVSTRSLDKIWPMMDGDKDDPDFVYIPSANFATYITETSRFGGSNKYTIIAGSINTNTTVLITRPEIKSLEDLDGKKVGLANQRYSDEYQFNEILSTAGLATKTAGGSVEVVYDDIVMKELENFGAGVYDAIIIYDPMNFENALSKVPGSKIMMSLNPDGMFGEKQPRSWLVAKKDIMKNEPELVKEVLKTHIMATDKAQEGLAKIPAVNREVFLKYFERLNADMTDILKIHTPEFYEKKWQEAEITYDPNMDFITGVFGFMEKKDVVKGKSLDDFVQVQFLNEVLEDMGRKKIQ
ncbi:ABC transporter substrate-binding protein [Phosphitispora fastidiosa]|uniref:ABC transporter substrate-binding protein n=1 Tax=Phosphitispora fastidiosa TaxID=2837202 RepID=UPI001E60152A|nr:ABC transporter substrate-binding protein [Phosphitispora fastidiosa]MBU7006231.1 ABC-type nitrate/sulfonate/bicarbonate transport system substrate-binding protein [Phosphitispora fastidiosa]